MATSIPMLCEKAGQVSVRLADGTVVNVPGVRMDLAVTFEDFDSTESFLVLDMDNYDLILGMPVEETEKIESAACVFSVGNVVPRGAKKTKVSALLNLEELSMKDFLAELKAGEIAEMVLLKPETSPEDLNSSSVMDEDVPEGFTKQRATRLGSEILNNPEDPVYPLVKEYSDVVSKHPPSQLPPDRGVRHEIDLVPGTKYCVTRQWPLPREQCEVIDAFFAEKAKSGMVRESKSPHSTPTFCTPIPRKDVLLNKMSGCTLYSALDLVDGYYQIL
ncbi:Reverse transcriptase, partial [Phytophthora palmivora]